MPRWDYRCVECGRVEEAWAVNLSDAQLMRLRCTCGATAPMQRVTPAVSFTIKGFSTENGYSK